MRETDRNDVQNKQTDGPTEKRTDRQTDIKTDSRETDKQKDRRSERYTVSQIARQTDRQANCPFSAIQYYETAYINPYVTFISAQFCRPTFAPTVANKGCSTTTINKKQQQ